MGLPVKIDSRTPGHCHRCRGPALLRIEVPDPDWPGGAARRVLVLCPQCDAGEHYADGLLAFFALYPTLALDNADEFRTLIDQWTSIAASQTPGNRADR
jgi:hypothetical protein